MLIFRSDDKSPLCAALRYAVCARPQTGYLHCFQVSRQKDLPEAGAKNLVCKYGDCFLRPTIALRLGSGLFFAIFLLYIKLERMVDLHTIFPTLTLFDLAGLLSATLAAALVIVAAVKMQKSRLKVYELFKDAVLVQSFLVRAFLSYRAQLLALLVLVGNICVLFVLYYMIRQEKASNGICAS